MRMICVRVRVYVYVCVCIYIYIYIYIYRYIIWGEREREFRKKREWKIWWFMSDQGTWSSTWSLAFMVVTFVLPLELRALKPIWWLDNDFWDIKVKIYIWSDFWDFVQFSYGWDLEKFDVWLEIHQIWSLKDNCMEEESCTIDGLCFGLKDMLIFWENRPQSHWFHTRIELWK